MSLLAAVGTVAAEHGRSGFHWPAVPEWLKSVPAGAVAGFAVGRFWDRFEESRRWRRNTLLKSVSAAVAATQNLMQALATLVRRVPDHPDEYDALVANYVEAAQLLSHGLNEVGLLDGANLYNTGDDLRTYVNGDLIRLVRDRATFTTAVRDAFEVDGWAPFNRLGELDEAFYERARRAVHRSWNVRRWWKSHFGNQPAEVTSSP